ncbi:MAG: 2-deoxy-D-gluconate 3-dehydrogenase [Planctomycetaceae bacterium]|nr:2-deoxy-D-gluconate 3-dehydrogenase [Planctomycetaceae bacterium]
MSFLDSLFSLHGKRAVVTGAARGLGLAMTEGLLHAGADVVMVGSNEERLNEEAAIFESKGLRATPMTCDLAEPEQLSALIDNILTGGPVQVLVNNAGVTHTHELAEYPDEAWNHTFDVNVRAPFQLAKRLSPIMIENRGGSIINITSIAAEVGMPNNPAYIAAKGALKQLTCALAADLGEYGVRVNNIGPGYFKTDMAQLSWNDPERRKARAERALLKRWGEPIDLVGAVIYLASDASSFVTGQSLYVDGGWLAKGL